MAVYQSKSGTVFLSPCVRRANDVCQSDWRTRFNTAMVAANQPSGFKLCGTVYRPKQKNGGNRPLFQQNGKRLVTRTLCGCC